MDPPNFGGESAIAHTTVVMRDAQRPCQDPSRACVDRTCFLASEEPFRKPKNPTKASRARVSHSKSHRRHGSDFSCHWQLDASFQDIERLWLLSAEVYTPDDAFAARLGRFIYQFPGLNIKKCSIDQNAKHAPLVLGKRFFAYCMHIEA